MSPIDNGLQDEEKSFEWVKKGRDLTHLPLIAVMTFPTILNDIDSAPRRIDVNLIEIAASRVRCGNPIFVTD